QPDIPARTADRRLEVASPGETEVAGAHARGTAAGPPGRQASALLDRGGAAGGETRTGADQVPGGAARRLRRSSERARDEPDRRRRAARPVQVSPPYFAPAFRSSAAMS